MGSISHLKLWQSKKCHVYLILFLLKLCLEVTDTFASTETCNVGGRCLHTWTMPTLDINKSTVFCECQSSTMFDYQNGASCRYSDLTDGPQVRINEGYCMTFDDSSNITYMGKCPYNHINSTQHPAPTLLPRNVYDLNNFMCNGSYRLHYVCGQQRREGLLCSKCQKGLGPAVASYTHQCAECHWYGPLLYITYVFVPATVFGFIIIILRINLLSPPMNALVLLCHVLLSYANNTPCRLLFYAEEHHSSVLILIVITIYGFLNMDFFSYVLPPFCISNKMSTLQVIALDYIVAVYPLVFTAMIYLLIEVHDRGFRPLVVMWSPFHRCLVRFRKSWNIKGSVINAFATLYVLSFTKIISTTVSLMLSAHIVDVCGYKHPGHLYYDASCRLFQQCHLPYAILSLSAFICFLFVPTVFILFYPCQRLLCKYCSSTWCFTQQRLTLLHEVAKIFHQSFKDGTDGTRDCRWFAGVYLVARITIVSSVIWNTSKQVRIISSTIGLFLLAVFQPHVSNSYNCLDSFLFGGLAAIFVLLPASQSRHITQVLIYFIPLIVMIIQLCWKSKCKAVFCITSLRNFMRAQVFRYRETEINHSCSSITAEEHKPLLKKVKSPEVTKTVINITSYGPGVS